MTTTTDVELADRLSEKLGRPLTPEQRGPAEKAMRDALRHHTVEDLTNLIHWMFRPSVDSFWRQRLSSAPTPHGYFVGTLAKSMQQMRADRTFNAPAVRTSGIREERWETMDGKRYPAAPRGVTVSEETQAFIETLEWRVL